MAMTPAVAEARDADRDLTLPAAGSQGKTGSPSSFRRAKEGPREGLAMSVSIPTSSSSLHWAERPGRELLRLAWPITVSMISFSTMTLASTAFVARVGSDELAGVGLAGVVGFSLVCFGIGLLRGAKTLVSQAVGAGRRERIPELLGTPLPLAGVLGAVALAAPRLVPPPLAA